MNDKAESKLLTEIAVQAIETTLDDLVAVAEDEVDGETYPATAAYMVAQRVELPIYGQAIAAEVVAYLKLNGHEIPNEFTAYYETELEKTNNKDDATLRAMARRGIEQVVYEKIADE